MIENHYELNIALKGQHWARVKFSPSLTKQEAQWRSETIAMGFRATHDHDDWDFKLTHIECVGRDVSF